MSTPTPYPQSKQTPRPFNSISPAPQHTSSPLPFSHHQIYKSPLKQANNTAHSTPTPAGFGTSPSAQLEGRGRGTTVGTKSSINNEEPAAAGHAESVGLALRDISETALLRLLDVTALVATGTEEERIHRTANIIQLLSSWGPVSQEGVEGCVQRLGLEWTWEDGVGASLADERERTLSIAGSHLLIEIKWIGDTPQKVSLEFPDAGDWAEKSATKAADTLLNNLTRHALGRKAYLMLDAFSKNLSHLANLDKLGREGISCFRAIEGLYSCFRKIWEFELSRTEKEETQDARESNVECQKIGCPQVHVSNQVGFRLTYWTDRRRLSRKRSTDTMDIDGEARPQPRPRFSSNSYHLLIDCEAFPSNQYPSIRLSESWTSEAVGGDSTPAEMLMTGEKYSIDWVDPPPTLLASPHSIVMDIDSSLLDQQSRFPNVRFVAILDPPVTVPLQIAVQLFNLVGSPLMQDSVHSTSYTFLTLEKAMSKAPRRQNTNATQEDGLHFKRNVRSYHNGVCREHIHHYRLFVQHNGWARTIDRIPFAHPKQLATMLPVLRQWAFLESLLKRSLGINEDVPPHNSPRHQPTTPPSDTDSDTDSASNTAGDDKPTLSLNGTTAPLTVEIDLTLTLDAVPTLAITSYSSRDIVTPFTSLRFQIESNAELVLEEADIMPGDESGRQAAQRRREKILGALGICEDVGVLLEWVG